MDELSTQELRGAAFAANLRRAYGAPVEGDLPSAFAILLARLDEELPAPSAQRPHPRESCRLRS